MHLVLAAFAVSSSGIVTLLLGALMMGAVLSYSGTGGGAMDQALGTFGAYVDQEFSATALTGGGAITATHGTLIITDAGVGAYTLAAPVAGTPANGGNDGQRLRVISNTAQAHTISTPANKLNGNKFRATCAAAVGDEIAFTAWNGVWLANPSNAAWVIT